MRHSTIAAFLVALFGVPLAALAQSEPPESTASDLPPSAKAERSVRSADIQSLARRLLIKRIEEVDWVEATFEEVTEWLRREGDDQVNVVPRWKRLSEEGVERDTPVTLKLRNVPVAEILNEVLEQLSDEHVLRYVATENKIKITTRRELELDLVTQVYHLPDLLFRIPDMGRSAPQVDLDAASRQGGQGGGGGGGQSIFGGAGASSSDELEEEEQEIEELLTALKTLIEDQVQPTSWQKGGGPGVISLFGEKTLVITNTIDVHEQLAGFFLLAK